MDHFFQIRERRPRRGADARGHDGARVHGRALEPGADRPDGRRRPLPPGPRCGSRRRRRSTCCPAAAPGWASAPPGTSRSRTGSGSRSRRSASGSRCSRTRCATPTTMWSGERGTEAAFEGRHVAATHLLNSPAVDQPAAAADHDRGRRRAEDAAPGRAGTPTRRNVFGGPETIHHKYEVLRRHCEAIGRDPDEIERSTLQSVRIAVDGGDGESPQQVIDRFGELADAGCQHVIFGVHDVWDPRTIERARPGRAARGREALGLSPRRRSRSCPTTRRGTASRWRSTTGRRGSRRRPARCTRPGGRAPASRRGR